MNVFYSNVCSLRNKTDELHQVAQGSDIIGLAETWLDPNDCYCMNGFVAHREDREHRSGGGCALLIREDLPHSRCSGLQRTDNIQSVVCDIYLKQTVRIVCVYRSPSSSPEEDSQLLKNLRDLLKGRQKWLLIGDLNAPSIDWRRQTASNKNSFDHQLIKFTQEMRAHQHVCQPTRIREGVQPSLLDLVVTPYETDVANLNICPPVGKSDHVVLKATLSVTKVKAPKMRYRAYRKMDSQAVLQNAHQLNWEAEGVENLWVKIKSNILSLEDKHVPLMKKRNDGTRPWYTAKVRRWTVKKNNAWKAYRKNPGDKKLRKYKILRNKTIEITRQSKSFFELKLARDVQANPKRFYAYVQSHTRLRRQVTRVLKTDRGEITDDTEIAEKFRQYFLSVYRKDSGEPLSIDAHRVPTEAMQMVTVSIAETFEELTKLKPSKSMGPDGLHPAMLKALAPVLAAPLTELFNRSLSEGLIPRDWRRAIVVPIHKGKELDSEASYRPVSLTSVPAKVLERLLRKKITEYLLTNHLINPAQHGFLKGKSCLTNLLLALDEITDALDHGEKVVVGYLDFQKAFDSVNHRFLIHKLKSYGIAPGLCAWIQAFLIQRTFQVKVRDALSQVASPTSGVPQGTVLGPLLFLVYINDLTVDLRNSCLLFADDVKIISTLVQGSQLQRDLNEIHEWSKKWDLPLNPLKCCLLGEAEGTFLIGDSAIPSVSHAKDLGVTLTSSFTPSEQCTMAATKARRALYVLASAVTSRKPEIWIPLYCAFVRPHLEYCVQAWAPYLKKDIRVMEKVQRLATRWVDGLKGQPYKERLKRLGLFSLERRRLRGDLIEVYKIIHGLSGDDLKTLLPLRDGRELRGHAKMLKKSHVRLDVRKAFFTNRVVNPWNSLPKDVVDAPSLRVFKERLDESWENCFPNIF